jgi:hypothetical protein
MADTASSLLSTVLRPVRVVAPLTLSSLGEVCADLPIIEFPCFGKPEEAAKLYAGQFDFAGATVNATPTSIFTVPAPSPAWLSALQGLSWLQHFRASGKIMHAHMAAKLLDAWSKSTGGPTDASACAESILNYCIHGPHLIDRALPEAVKSFQMRLRGPLKRLSKLKARGEAEALQKSMAMLCGNLAVSSNDSQITACLGELSTCAKNVFNPDGSHISGDAQISLNTTALILALLKETSKRGSFEPEQLSQTLDASLSYLTMLQTPAGNLAFTHDGADTSKTLHALKAMRLKDVLEKSSFVGLAQFGGKARLTGNATTVMVSYKPGPSHKLDFKMEIWRKGELCFLLQDNLSVCDWKSGMANLYIADSGTLFTLPSLTDDGARRILSVFLSKDGTDLRIENECAFTDQNVTLIVSTPDFGKLSSQQNGQGAVITGGRNHAWQMSSRGAELLSFDKDLHVRQAANQSRMNVGFRLAAATKRQPSRPEIGTLL